MTSQLDPGHTTYGGSRVYGGAPASHNYSSSGAARPVVNDLGGSRVTMSSPGHTYQPHYTPVDSTTTHAPYGSSSYGNSYWSRHTVIPQPSTIYVPQPSVYVAPPPVYVGPQPSTIIHHGSVGAHSYSHHRGNSLATFIFFAVIFTLLLLLAPICLV